MNGRREDGRIPVEKGTLHYDVPLCHDSCLHEQGIMQGYISI